MRSGMVVFPSRSAAITACLVASVALYGTIRFSARTAVDVTGQTAEERRAALQVEGSTDGPFVRPGTALTDGWRQLTVHAHAQLAERLGGRRRAASPPLARTRMNVVISLPPGGKVPEFAARIMDGPRSGCWRLSSGGCALPTSRVQLSLTIYQKTALSAGTERNGSRGAHHVSPA